MSDDGSSNKPLVAAVLLVVGILACSGVVAGVGVLAAIAIPNFVAMQLKAKRAEVPGNVNGIRTAEMAYYAAFDKYIAVGPAPRSVNNVGKQAVPWLGDPAWDELNWQPDGNVRGVYWVELTPTGFEAHGVCDVDGDRQRAEYVATEVEYANQRTERDEY